MFVHFVGEGIDDGLGVALHGGNNALYFEGVRGGVGSARAGAMRKAELGGRAHGCVVGGAVVAAHAHRAAA